jgi:hypothetical protein
VIFLGKKQIEDDPSVFDNEIESGSEVIAFLALTGKRILGSQGNLSWETTGSVMPWSPLSDKAIQLHWQLFWNEELGLPATNGLPEPIETVN